MESIILIIIGLLYIRMMYKFRNDPNFASNYVKNNIKAYTWKKMFGEEKALRLIRTVFIPVGFVISVGFILYGVYLFLY